MLIDLLVLALIIVVAVVLGLLIHPALFLLLILAAVFVLFRRPWGRHPRA